MNKSTNIILISLLMILIVILTIIMVIGIKKGSSIFAFDIDDAKLVKEESIDLEEIKNIEMNFVSEDIKIYVTDEDKLLVKQYSNKSKKDKNLFTYKIENNIIKLKGKENIFCIGFCFNYSYFEVYIPRTYVNDLYIHSTSGDIDVLDSLKVNNLDFNTTSGDIKIEGSLNSNELNLKTVSGDIEANSIETGIGKLNTTSGDIDIEYLTGEYNIKTISGEIEVNNFDGNFNISSTSGDVLINNFGIITDSSIKTISGDVDVILQNNYECRVETNTVSGSERIRNSNNSGKLLKIKTTSGDIKVR